MGTKLSKTSRGAISQDAYSDTTTPLLADTLASSQGLVATDETIHYPTDECASLPDSPLDLALLPSSNALVLCLPSSSSSSSSSNALVPVCVKLTCSQQDLAVSETSSNALVPFNVKLPSFGLPSQETDVGHGEDTTSRSDLNTYEVNTSPIGCSQGGTTPVARHDSELSAISTEDLQHPPTPAEPSQNASRVSNSPARLYQNSTDGAENFEVSLTLDDRKNLYSWNRAGLKMYIPYNPLVNGKYIDFRVYVNDGFHFPINTKPVSAIFAASTDLTVEPTLEFEHCFRGDERDLAFAYCQTSEPPFYFSIASRKDYECSFTYSRGTVRAKLFPYWTYWAIVRCYHDYSVAHVLTDDDDSQSNHHDDSDQHDDNNHHDDSNCHDNKSDGCDQGIMKAPIGSGGSNRESSKLYGQSSSQSRYSRHRSYSSYQSSYHRQNPSRQRHRRGDDSGSGEDGGGSGGATPTPQNYGEEELSIIPYYQTVRSHIKVNLVVTQNLCAYHEVNRTFMVESSKVPSIPLFG